MSYEGHVQVLCQNGHYNELDVYETQDLPCEICGASWAWTNSVNDTNCDSSGHVDIEQHIKTPREDVTAQLPDGRWATYRIHPVYNIPENPRHLYWDYVQCVWRDLQTLEVVGKQAN